jgi:hypothetical protein
MRRDLNLSAPGKESCRVLVDLVHAVTEKIARNEWLRMLDAEHGYLIALTRLSAEKRKEAREARV